MTLKKRHETILVSENKPAVAPWSVGFSVVTLLEIMQYKLDMLLWIAHKLSETKDEHAGSPEPLSSISKTNCISFFGRVIEICNDLELSTTKVLAERLISQLRLDTRPTLKMELAQGCLVMENTMSAELSTITFFRISKFKIETFSQKTPLFGAEVDNAFPSASYDISESGKCLALDRSTAAVFHCMKPMEVALQALAKHVGATMPPVLQWGFIEGAIKNVKSTDPFVIDAMPLFFSVKTAWRNPTMHVAVKYTAEEAEAIFNAVKGFMQHLATQLHE